MFSFQHFKDVLLSSEFYNFWLEVFCHSNCFLLVCKLPFFCGCFQNFLFTSDFQQLTMKYLVMVFLTLTLLEFDWAQWICKGVSSTKFGKFSGQYFFKCFSCSVIYHLSGILITHMWEFFIFVIPLIPEALFTFFPFFSLFSSDLISSIKLSFFLVTF